MRILHICLANFYIDNYSYQENMLPKYHYKLGHKVEIIASLVSFDESGQACLLDKGSSYINEDGIPVTRLEFKKSKLNKRFRSYIGTYDAIVRANPDIIFVHGCQFLDIKYVKKYVQQYPEVKVYVDNHADFSNSATNWLSKNILHKIIWRHCARRIEPYTTKFYGVLPARVDFLGDMYGLPRDKIELLVMGADDELVASAKCAEVRNSIREKYGIDDDDFLIMTGGKIDRNKLQTLLLMEAMQGLKTDKVKLIVFGSVLPEYTRRFTELLGNNVIYAGWVQATETYKYFNAADLVVFPGLHSVFWEQVVGLGKPCLFKYIQGFTHIDVGGNCDFLYEDSADEIKVKILSMLESPDKYERMKSVAQTEGMNAFSYRTIAEKSIKPAIVSEVN